jgi:PKD repeat protein
MSIIFVNNKPTLQTNITDSGVRTSETLSTLIGQNNFNFITNPPTGSGSPSASAAFTYNSSIEAENESVVFTDASTGEVTSWHWDFGDGETSSLQNPSHTYANPGIYNVVLTVNFDVSVVNHLITIYSNIFSQPMSGESLTGTLDGSADYSSNSYIQLTTLDQFNHGAIDYNVSDVLGTRNRFIIKFDVYALGTADAAWLYMFRDDIPTLELASGAGYHLIVGEYPSRLALHYNSELLAVQDFTLGPNLADGTWRTIKVIYDNQNFQIYLDGTLFLQFDDSGNTRDLSGTHIGLAGRCGAATAVHRVKNFYAYGRVINFIGRWLADENGGTTLADSSGNSFDGTLSGTASLSEGNLVLSSSNPYTSGGIATIPHDTELNAYPITVSFWFNMDVVLSGSVGNVALLEKYLSSSLNGYIVYLNSGYIYAWYMAAADKTVWGGGYGLEGGPYEANTWYLLTFTVDHNGGKLYVNDTLKDSKTWSGLPAATTTTTDIILGHYDSGYIPGKLDDIRIYDNALTAEEISDFFFSGRTPVASTPVLSLSGSESFTNIETGIILNTSITDTNGGNQTITITVTGGTVSLATLTGLTGSGNGTNSLTYSGTLTNINSAIASLSFIHNLGLDGGSASVEITVDNGYGTDTETCEITISAFVPLTMVLYTNADTQFIMPLANETANFEVDWGDGTVETHTSYYPVGHTYAETGDKTIAIRGVMPRWDFTTYPSYKGNLSAISSWGDVEWSSMAGSFTDCDGLVSVGTGVIRTTDVSNAWKGCTNLTTFGASDFTSVENISHAWEDCVALATFSVTDFPATTNASYAWKGCSSLSGVPIFTMPVCTNFAYTWAYSGIAATNTSSDLSSGTDFNHAWAYCTNLAASDLDLSSGTNFRCAWHGCTSLNSFVSDVSAGTDFRETWKNCTALSTFSSGITMAQGVYFDNAWENCSSLTSFGTYAFTNGQLFDSAWKGCSNLTSFNSSNTFPAATTFVEAWANSGIVVWPSGSSFPVATNMSYAWSGCTDMTAFNAMTIPYVTNLNYAWYGCSGLTGFPTLTYTRVDSLYAAWRGCTGLISFPNISLPSVASTGLTQSWFGCSNLTTMGSVTATSAAALTQTWKDCGALESIGTLTFVSLESLNNTFEGCVSLVTMPALGNQSNVTSMVSTWYGCGSLESIGAFDTDVDCTYDNIVGGCAALESFGLENIYTNISFSGCNLSTANINTIFGNLATVDPTQTINIAGNPGAFTATNSTATGKGWTVVPDAPVLITSGAEHWIAENSSNPIVGLTATGATGTTITFNVVAGVGDYTLFDVDVENQLFAISPGLNYEAWTDEDGDGIYSVRVRATDGYSEDFLDLEINPTDVNEELAGSWIQYEGELSPGQLYLQNYGSFTGSYNGYHNLVIYKTDQNSYDHDFDSSYVGRLIRLVHTNSGTNQICAIVAASYADPHLELTLDAAIGITDISFPVVGSGDLILVEMLDNSAQIVMYNATSGYFNVYPGATNRDYNVDQSSVADDFSAHATAVEGYALYHTGTVWKRFLYWLDQITTPMSNSTDTGLQFSANVTPILTKITEGADARKHQFTVSMVSMPGYAEYTTFGGGGSSETSSNISFDEYGFIINLVMGGTYTLLYGGVGYTSATYEAIVGGARNTPIHATGVALDLYNTQTGVNETTESYTLVTIPSGFTALTSGSFKFQAAGVNSSTIDYNGDSSIIS